MHRRRFFALFARSVGALSLCGVACWPRSSGNSSHVLRDRLCRAFSKLRTTGLIDSERALIGAAYLEDHPAEATPDRLVAAIVSRLSRGAGTSGKRTLYAWSPERLAALIQSDFAQGRTVRVEGWVLSRTEAQLYALTSLS